MSTSEAFTFLEKDDKQPQLFDDFQRFNSGKATDIDVQVTAALRAKYPELCVTSVPSSNCNLLQFVAAGYATAHLDKENEPVLRWRGFVGPSHRGGSGHLADAIFFAKYNYEWNSNNFILYNVTIGYGQVQYVLTGPVGDETTYSNSAVTDALLSSIGAWLTKEEPAIYVYDGYWRRDAKLWESVEKSSWDDVILDPKMKKALKEVTGKFFDSKDIYDEFGVPWKRGLIFHGPVGNGKTISLKALMRTLYHRDSPVVSLYVKNAPYSYNIRDVFQMARSMTPCLLVFEDIDTVVTQATRSYFFNEVDGLANNDGILMIATTNHLDQLDPGLSKRPSRFDRLYLFPRPNKDERVLYAEYWRQKLKNKPAIEFPKKLTTSMAEITDDFSFAYLKEAFVATLLDLAHNCTMGDESDNDGDDDGDDPLDKYELWKEFKAQVKVLRDEMGSTLSAADGSSFPFGNAADYEEMIPLLADTSLRGNGGGSQPCGQPSVAAPGFGFLDTRGAAVDKSASALSPLSSFSPLANKRAKYNDGVWEWGPR
ncbi:P-loop containing nucleoside triphosphate hydrolase protein [Mytilinidion resinicola]|uniref:P-loop containing nucleoside triphosphate hydrolase protein n=1 Tax=Mytilinidion resinicola TaxID=574789 RepID=A0A6A6YQ16_9PEZI|nr:P-loop containing nucleoside triphosphate hydrolase protein [Mytilinidion resinicola]KAF2810075.1 P-loop containing nucleoside triphosphate hydrolase protein [Mytilinidion resinicola]